MRRCNLVLATMGEACETTQDLELIARRVEQADPRVNAVVLRNSPAHRLSHAASQFGALTKCAAILAEATPRLATMRLPFQTVEGKRT